VPQRIAVCKRSCDRGVPDRVNGRRRLRIVKGRDIMAPILADGCACLDEVCESSKCLVERSEWGFPRAVAVRQ
jgi:hypothetical protein